MNLTNIERLAKAVETSETFWQEAWFTKSKIETEQNLCGTPACIAGHAMDIIYSDKGKDVRTMHEKDVCVNISNEAGNWLGLGIYEAETLFTADPFELVYDLEVEPYVDEDFYYGDWLRERDIHAHVTEEQAAWCLRNLAKTGKVDWVEALDLHSDIEAYS